jgi:hypothetical protein
VNIIITNTNFTKFIDNLYDINFQCNGEFCKIYTNNNNAICAHKRFGEIFHIRQSLKEDI